MRLLFILGTRPEAIKLAPVILEARRRASAGIETFVVSTGQHRELLDHVLGFFDIKPDADLALMQPNQDLAGLTARALEGLSCVLAKREPDAVIVQGDTTTAMCGALAAFYRGIPVAHVEAGLRTNDLAAPFPEEANRRIVGQLARWHFAPTARAKQSLLSENLPPEGTEGARIVVTGNTVIDALDLALDRIRSNPPRGTEITAARSWINAGAGNSLVLVTGHRRENFGEPFEEFCLGLLDIARAHPKALILYPVHLNPNVQEPVRRLLGGTENIRLAPPVHYPEFVALMDLARLIVTDSGGVQEEAPHLGVPVLVTREKTERPEAVESGCVKLVGPSRETLFKEADRLLSDTNAYEAMARAVNPYGDGKSAGRCIDALLGKAVSEFEAGPEKS